MHRLLLTIALLTPALSGHTREPVGCDVVSGVEAKLLLRLSTTEYVKDRIIDYAVCSDGKADIHFVVANSIPITISTIWNTKPEDLQATPIKIQNFQLKRETWLASIELPKLEELNELLKYVTSNNHEDNTNVLDGETWCITADNLERCYNAPDYNIKKRDLKILNQLGSELRGIFGSVFD